MANDEAIISGFVGTEVELTRAESAERDWVRFRVGSTPRFRDSTGQWRDGETVWYTCKAWGKLAHNISSSLRKGYKVILRGRLSASTWQRDAPGGGHIERTEVVIHISSIGIDLAKHVVNVRSTTGGQSDIDRADSLRETQDDTRPRLVADGGLSQDNLDNVTSLPVACASAEVDEELAKVAPF